jgi:hypothetical protein
VKRTTIPGSAIRPSTGGLRYYSPAFPRRGKAATFTVHVADVSDPAALGVAIEHKSAKGASWATAATFLPITGAAVATKDIRSLDEVLRFAFELDAGSPDDWAQVTEMMASWREYN